MGLTPDYNVTGNNVNIDAIKKHLVSMSITDEAGQKNDTMQMTFDTDEHNLGLPALGSTIEVSIGYKERGLYSVGTFNLTKVTKSKTPQGHQLIVKATSISSNDAMRNTQTRSFEESTVGEVVETIAAEAGLETRIDPNIIAFTANMVQEGQSNQKLLAELAEKTGSIFKIRDNKIYFAKRANTETIAATPVEVPIVTINEEKEMISYNYELSNISKYTRVTAKYKDETTESIQKISVGEDGSNLELSTKYNNQAEANEAAKSFLNKSSREDAKLNFSTDGERYIPPESRLSIVSKDPDIDRGWIVTKASYSVSNSNITVTYNCDLQQTQTEQPTTQTEEIQPLADDFLIDILNTATTFTN